MDAVEDTQANGGLLIVVGDAIVDGHPFRVKVRLSKAVDVADANPDG